MSSNAKKQTGKFFGHTRTYTRHVRPQDEFEEDDINDAIFSTKKAPVENVPTVDKSVRTRLRRIDPTDESHYNDPIMEYEEMPVTAKEAVQFTQDVTSKEFVEVLSKKLHIHTQGSDAIEELFLASDDDDEDTISTTSSTHKETVAEGKNRRRKKRRAQQRNQLLFNEVPKIPDRFDHFYYITKDRRYLFIRDDFVQECTDQLTAYLYLNKDDWVQRNLGIDDIKDVVSLIGFFYLKTYRGVEGKYIVHVFSDMKQQNDSQVIMYDVLLFVACGKVKGESCYCIINYFFMKNEN